MAISLSKGQKISLAKETAGLTAVRMGLGWDAAKKPGFFKSLLGGVLGSGATMEIDLDASCILFDKDRTLLDTVWFRQLNSLDGSIRHTGDNRTGAGDGDDETIIVNLKNLSTNIIYLVFTVNSFLGQNFNRVEHAVCRLLDDSTGDEIVRFDLAEKGDHTGVVMAILSRQQGGWTLKASGTVANGRTVHDLIGPAIAAINTI